jgi:chlorophyll synthase
MDAVRQLGQSKSGLDAVELCQLQHSLVQLQAWQCRGAVAPTDPQSRAFAAHHQSWDSLCTGRGVPVRVVAEQATKEKKQDADSAARQMLGMKGAALETDKWKIRVQLTKPVTWIPLIWGEMQLVQPFPGLPVTKGCSCKLLLLQHRCGMRCCSIRQLRVEQPSADCSAAYMHAHVRASADWLHPGNSNRGIAGRQGCSNSLHSTSVSSFHITYPMSMQTINDWYDREIDAINEPYRPIPSGM